MKMCNNINNFVFGFCLRNASKSSDFVNGVNSKRSPEQVKKSEGSRLGEAEEFISIRDKMTNTSPKRKIKKASLATALAKTFLPFYSLAGVLLLLYDIVAFINPLLLKYVHLLINKLKMFGNQYN